MTVLRLFVIAFLLGFLCGGGTGVMLSRAWLKTSARQPQPLHPMSVTILDDGGANLKVESTIVEEGKKTK